METDDTPRSSIDSQNSPQIDNPLVMPVPLDRPKSAGCDIQEHHDAWYPRRLSFSTAQEAIETWYKNRFPESSLIQAISI